MTFTRGRSGPSMRRSDSFRPRFTLKRNPTTATAAGRPAGEFEAPPALRRSGRRARRLFRLLVCAFLVNDALVVVTAGLLTGTAPLTTAALTGAVLVSFALTGAYRQRISPTVGEEVPLITGRIAVPALLLGAVVTDGAEARDLLVAALLSIGFVVVGRATGYALVRRARRNGTLQEPTLIVGAGRQGVVMAETLKAHPEYGLIPVGFVDGFADELDPPIVGDVERLDELLEGGWVRRLIIAFGGTREAELVSILRSAERHEVEVHVLPRFFELGVSPSGGDTDVIWGIPLVRVRRTALRTAAWRSKRLFDICLAVVALVVAGPVMLAAALAVWLSSPGPVLFRQRRVGQSGREVEILKFRSMPVNSDSDRTWSVDADRRIGRIGRVMRKTSLDELPQLFNVLRGDMSLVGPRPERPLFVATFEEEVDKYADRHRVPVGMTGWAQIHRLRGDTSIEERARFDNFYIEHWSLWRDVIIMVRTVPAMLQRPPKVPPCRRLSVDLRHKVATSDEKDASCSSTT
jgi:exopolysaccharide biosynthesis polyprenyl glycosylphosphotransferase